jgi:hypothetical protein
MTELETAKYIRTGVTRPSNHDVVTSPIINLVSDKEFGDMGFTMYWQAITVPFIMNPDMHQHDFPQYLTFLGGDVTNMLELDGEIELILSEDGTNLEKHTITKATTVYIPAGLYHCPLEFKKVTRPILCVDIFFAETYERQVQPS